ncbi:MAG: peptide deformylase [Rhodospirillaceae bacterium]|nr:MAG: peptide deformylase [Rhodospirillaceae bacterium]
MTVMPISRMGAEVLKSRAAEVRDATDPAVHALVDDMLQTMIASHGVGLAAPQVGAPVRIVMFFVPAMRNNGVEIPLTIMVNPVIEPTGPDQAEDWEACLSVPGLTGRVPRWTSIRYSFTDLQGDKQVRDARDFHARVVQHECDHLDGVLYPMRMTDMGSLSFSDVLRAEAQAAGEDIDIDEEGVPLE